MTSAAHTPGPWFFNGDTGNDPKLVGYNVNVPDDGIVCELPEELPRRTLVANARLIAAAPELLESAQLVVARWERGDLAEAVRQLDAAIAQATTGTP